MSKLSGHYYHHSQPDQKIRVYTGFNWFCLFFGQWWFLYKHMWMWFVISLFTTIFTWGLTNIIYAFYANSLYEKSLIKKGYTKWAEN
tara:strand:+ start:4882 stop:5142 length:261 start_codon:yes stop_codon:yes gene_type:complete